MPWNFAEFRKLSCRIWQNLLRKNGDPDYYMFGVGRYVTDSFGWQVTTASLWSVRLMVLVKQEHRNKISHVQQSSVKTGIANTLGIYWSCPTINFFDRVNRAIRD